MHSLQKSPNCFAKHQSHGLHHFHIKNNDLSCTTKTCYKQWKIYTLIHVSETWDHLYFWSLTLGEPQKHILHNQERSRDLTKQRFLFPLTFPLNTAEFPIDKPHTQLYYSLLVFLTQILRWGDNSHTHILKSKEDNSPIIHRVVFITDREEHNFSIFQTHGRISDSTE